MEVFDRSLENYLCALIPSGHGLITRTTSDNRPDTSLTSSPPHCPDQSTHFIIITPTSLPSTPSACCEGREVRLKDRTENGTISPRLCRSREMSRSDCPLLIRTSGGMIRSNESEMEQSLLFANRHVLGMLVTLRRSPASGLADLEVADRSEGSDWIR